VLPKGAVPWGKIRDQGLNIAAMLGISIGILNILTLGFHLNGDYAVAYDGSFVDLRALNSIQALLLVGILARRPRDNKATGRERNWPTFVLMTLSLSFIVISQQRTVIVCLLLAALIANLLNPNRIRAIYIYASLIGATATLALTLLVPKALKAFSDSLTNEGTLGARQEGWGTLLQQVLQNPFTLLTGAPFGTGFSRVEGGQLVSQNPHNWYLFLLLRAGILGLLAFILVCMSLLKWARGNFFGGFIIFFTAFFGITYLEPPLLLLLMVLSCRGIEEVSNVRIVDIRNKIGVRHVATKMAD
jgi:O-antigen ligase